MYDDLNGSLLKANRSMPTECRDQSDQMKLDEALDRHRHLNDLENRSTPSPSPNSTTITAFNNLFQPYTNMSGKSGKGGKGEKKKKKKGISLVSEL